VTAGATLGVPRPRRADRDVGAGIYVHVPFCVTRCGYCDFNAYEGLDAMKPAYVGGLLREMELVAAEWSGEPIASIFFGGGTPSTLDPGDLAQLLDALRGHFDVAATAEVTIEANPESLDRERLLAPEPASP
jgi:oxygen-independent coproporphyrinogen-3 oxidase